MATVMYDEFLASKVDKPSFNASSSCSITPEMITSSKRSSLVANWDNITRVVAAANPSENDVVLPLMEQGGSSSPSLIKSARVHSSSGDTPCSTIELSSVNNVLGKFDFFIKVYMYYLGSLFNSS